MTAASSIIFSISDAEVRQSDAARLTLLFSDSPMTLDLRSLNPVTGQSERRAMDERAELAEGKKAHDEVLKEYGVYPDPKLQAYVNEIGQKLARQSHRANIDRKSVV